MRRRDFVAGIGAAISQFSVSLAQEVSDRPLVVVLLSNSNAQALIDEFFVPGMRELGYIEGRNYRLASRHMEGDLTRLPMLVADLLRLQPQVFVCGITNGALEIIRASKSIPIVNPSIIDPNIFGLGDDLSRPSGQLTGIVLNAESLPGKQLDLVIKLIPGLSKIGTMVSSLNSAGVVHTRRIHAAATLLGVDYIEAQFANASEIDTTFEKLAQARVDAVLLGPDIVLRGERKRVAGLAANARMPVMYTAREHVEAGGLISYGVNQREAWKRAATYVDKILRGAKPSQLPIEFPSKLELVINLKAAKAIELGIPPAVLAQADEIID